MAISIRAVSDLLTLLETAASDCLSREPSLQRARTICQVAQTAAKVLEVADLEGRVEALEAQTRGVQLCR